MSDELLPVDDQIAEFKRAIEAVILVSHDPVAPEFDAVKDQFNTSLGQLDEALGLGPLRVGVRCRVSSSSSAR